MDLQQENHSQQDTNTLFFYENTQGMDVGTVPYKKVDNTLTPTKNLVSQIDTSHPRSEGKSISIPRVNSTNVEIPGSTPKNQMVLTSGVFPIVSHVPSVSTP